MTELSNKEGEFRNVFYTKDSTKIIDLEDYNKFVLNTEVYDSYGLIFKGKKTWSRKRMPSLENSTLTFIPQTSNLFNNIPGYLPIQDNKITFGVDHIYGDFNSIQVKTNNSNWVNTDNQEIFTIEDHSLTGLQDVSLRVLNEYGEGDIMSNNITITKDGPTLTGQSINLKHINDEIIANYKSVFKNVEYYIVSCGSTIGSTDLLDFTETKEPELKFTIKNVLKIFVTVFGVNGSGFSIFKTSTMVI